MPITGTAQLCRTCGYLCRFDRPVQFCSGKYEIKFVTVYMLQYFSHRPRGGHLTWSFRPATWRTSCWDYLTSSDQNVFSRVVAWNSDKLHLTSPKLRFWVIPLDFPATPIFDGDWYCSFQITTWSRKSAMTGKKDIKTAGKVSLIANSLVVCLLTYFFTQVLNSDQFVVWYDFVLSRSSSSLFLQHVQFLITIITVFFNRSTKFIYSLLIPMLALRSSSFKPHLKHMFKKNQLSVSKTFKSALLLLELKCKLSSVKP